jgi:hypothetical protein
MATKNEIKKRFVEDFPHLTGVEWHLGRVALGPSHEPLLGLAVVRTLVYALAVKAGDGAIIPVTAEVKEWREIRKLLWSGTYAGCLYRSIVLARVLYDHVLEQQLATFQLWHI